MKRSRSHEDLTKIEKKRKKPILQINKVEYLLCEICRSKVYDYKKCVGSHIYCTHNTDCLEVLVLKSMNDSERTCFEDDLMLLDC